jgi:hypothetical protein
MPCFFWLSSACLYIMPKSGQQPQVSAQLGQNPFAAQHAAPTNVTVGNSANIPDAMKQGQVTQINGGTLTLKDHASGQAYTVATDAQTQIELAGQPKSQVEYQKEMGAYNAQIQQLIQDPVKNKTVLASLVLPIPIELKPIALASLQVGDAVEVTAASAITGTSFTAKTIVKTPSGTN